MKKLFSSRNCGDFEFVDPITEAKINQIMKKIIELIKSSDTSQHLKAVNAIQTLLTDGLSHFCISIFQFLFIFIF
jgi:hypothetical protein